MVKRDFPKGKRVSLFVTCMVDISGAMLAKKVENISSCPAQVVGSYVSCQTHINGGLEKMGTRIYRANRKNVLFTPANVADRLG